MYAALNDVSHARDAAKGAELITALRKFGAFVLNEGLDFMAAMPLHGHFPVGKGEVILDTVSSREEKITGTVVSTDMLTDEHQATVWGFMSDGTPVELRWSKSIHVDPRLKAALQKVSEFLVREHLNTILAVTSRKEPFPMEAGKVLYEQTNETDRTQVMKVVSLDSVPPEQGAAWYFTTVAGIPSQSMRGHIKPEDVVMVTMRGCDPGCAPITNDQ